MKTTYELLMMLDRDELISQTIRLGLEPLPEAAEKDAWAQHIARGLETHWENLLLMLSLDDAVALHDALEQGDAVSRQEADGDGSLFCGLLLLEMYGLAEETDESWEIDPRVKAWLQLDEADRAQLHMQDALYDYMQGWLMHVGMMPMEELTARAAALVDPETREEREDLEQLCHGLLIARDGLEGMLVDEYDEPWAVHAELEDPETLLERLRMPFLRQMPYPAFDEDALVLAARESLLPGDEKLYIPLVDFLEANGCEDGNVLVADAAIMIQNEQVDEAIQLLTESCGLKSLRDIEQLTELVFTLSNSIPRWYNKGYSPEEMAARLSGKRSAMPGRNDPCPCGSGRKYKLCCGRRVQ